MQVKDLIKILEKDYPNDVIALKSKTEDERNTYIANLEMIEYIKRLEEDN